MLRPAAVAVHQVHPHLGRGRVAGILSMTAGMIHDHVAAAEAVLCGLGDVGQAQAARIGELETLVGRLAAENVELRRRLGSDSSNSSRPPSSDSPYDKPRPRPSGLRGRSGRKPGKQPAEPASALTTAATQSERS
jgi:hypothetical protein